MRLNDDLVVLPLSVARNGRMAVFHLSMIADAAHGPTLVDTGVWQSVSRTVSEIPVTLRRLGERITQAQERIAAIDRELARLEQWDGQATYDGATSELSAINAVFAAAEEQAGAEAGKAGSAP